MTTLTGTELVTIYPQRANSPNGTPTAAEAQATTQAIADLASVGVTLGGDLAGIPSDATVVAYALKALEDAGLDIR